MKARRGFALIAALWLLVAISAVSLQMSMHARASRGSAINTLEDGRARAAARAGLEHARARLVRGLGIADESRFGSAATWRSDPWRGADTLLADTVALGVERYHVQVRDAGASLSLNAASEAELRGLLQALRVDAGDADRIAQAIADWRDADDLHRARGAERSDYVAMGAAELPRNGPFERVDELRDVKGVTPELYERVRTFVTVAGSGLVNVNGAPLPVLLALPGIGEEAAAAIVRMRQSGRPVASVQELSLLLSSRGREALNDAMPRLLVRATFEARELEVSSFGWSEGGRVTARASGLLVRAGDAAYYTWRSVE